MKKLAAIFLAAILLLGTAACQSSYPGGNPTEAPHKGPTKAPAASSTETLLTPADYSVQYIRTDGYHKGARFPRAVTVTSPEELTKYYETNKDIFWLERNPNPAADGTRGFLDACDSYTKEFFETNYLVFVLLEEGSGSIRHRVEGVTHRPDGTLQVSVTTLTPEVGTCDMAQWHIILALPLSAKVEDGEKVQIVLDGRLPGGEEDATQIGTQLPVVLKAPPKAELLFPSGSVTLTPGGYGWIFPGKDGTTAAQIADHAHPLDCKDRLKPIRAPGGYGKIDFGDAPDSVTVRCWPYTKWGCTEDPGQTVPWTGGAFAFQPGGWIYEITATWNENENAHHGTASYIVYILTETP